MARIINRNYEDTRALTDEQRKDARRKLRATQNKNRMRRIRLACDDRATRDPSAQLGDHVWCETHSDWAQVVNVTE